MIYSKMQYHLFNLAKTAITHLALGHSPQNLKIIEGPKHPLGQVIPKMCKYSGFGEICMTY